MVSSSAFLGAAPSYGSVETFLSLLRSLDPTVPADATTQNAQPGNLGWQIFGWGNDDLNNSQISSQFFWNRAASYFGWPAVAPTVPATSAGGPDSLPAVVFPTPALPVLAVAPPSASQVVSGTAGSSVSAGQAAQPVAVAPVSPGLPWWVWALAFGGGAWWLWSKR